MTVQQDLQKALATAEAAQGTYLMFAQSTRDETAREMFHAMADDVDLHAMMLKDRLQYLQETNPLNSRQS